MINNLKIFESNIKHGPMSMDKRYYPKSWNDEQIISDFESRVSTLGEEVGFDNRKIVLPHRDDIYMDQHKTTGSYINVDNDLVEMLQNKKGMYLPFDIIMTNSNVSDVVLASTADDMPVVIMEDLENNAIALAYCDQAHITEKMPLYMVNALRSVYDSKPSDIKAYISSCANPESYVFRYYPMWAYDDEVWKGSVNCESTKGKEKYYINLKSAILRQLLMAGISAKNIKSNMHDTIGGFNPELYSAYASSIMGKERKQGKYLVGAFYEGEKVRIKK